MAGATQERARVVEQLSRNPLLETVMQVQEVGMNHNIQPIVVGGLIARLIGPQTRIAAIDIASRTIRIANPAEPSTTRKERFLRRNVNTPVDIDFVCTPTDSAGNFPTPYVEAKQSFTDNFAAFYDEIRQAPLPNPVTTEPIHYVEEPQQATSWRSFTSNMAVTPDNQHGDPRGKPFFVLGDIQTELNWETVKPWKIAFEGKFSNYSFYAFDPYTTWLRYFVRNFGELKKKDQQKITGGDSLFTGFVMDFIRQYAQELDSRGENGMETIRQIYEPLSVFRHELQNDHSIITSVKKGIVRRGWDTGFFDLVSHVFTNMADKFTGVSLRRSRRQQ